MGNLTFEVIPDRTNSGPAATARVRAAGAEFRGAIRTLIEDAVAEGVRIAKAGAPRGDNFHEGRRIEDAITASPVRYHAGGAGGGGYFEASIQASAAIAPQVEWVFEGTGERGNYPRRITPAQGNVFPIQKLGERVQFRTFTRGQFPQQRWWHDAEAGVDEMLAFGVRSLGI